VSFNLLDGPFARRSTRLRPADLVSVAAAASPGCGAKSRRRAHSSDWPVVKGEGALDESPANGQAAVMTMPTTDPDRCTTMSEVRAGVDRVDGELLALLARRFGYMRAAARIKDRRDSVRDEERKAAVIASAAARARELDLPVAGIAELWDRLVELSIAFELDEWDRLRQE
jgi:isochorismate pyruvate lyase